MLTRRQFTSILLMFVALLILFQGPEIAKQNWSDYSGNGSGSSDDAAYDSSRQIRTTSGRYAIYIGDVKSRAFKTCSEWAVYSKRNLKSYPSLSANLTSQLSASGFNKAFSVKSPDLICVDRTVLEAKNGVQNVTKLLKTKVPVLFVNLPDANRVMRDEALQKLLGIYYVQMPQVKSAGIHLYEGLFLGGERIYQAENAEEAKKRQDLNLNVPWYVPAAGCRTFMSAIITDTKKYVGIRNQDMPALIWRTPEGNSSVYVINGSYMDNRRIGIGILDGVLADAYDCTIYPVVNAQSLILNGFPELYDENETKIRSVYGYSQPEFQKNILQPGIWSLIRTENWRPTAMVLPRYDYQENASLKDGALHYYLQQLREVKGEAGISFRYTGTGDVQNVIDSVSRTLRPESDGYTYETAYVPRKTLPWAGHIAKSKEGKSLTTYLTDYNESDHILGSASAERVRQMILSDAATHTYTEDLELLGVESALGYSTVSIDLTRTLWPKSREDEWENLSKEALSNISTYWRYFDGFDRTTVSAGGRKAKNFLDMDYDIREKETKGDEETLELTARSVKGETDYLIRLHDAEVTGVGNGSFKKLEDNVFLLKVTGEKTSITIKKVNEA